MGDLRAKLLEIQEYWLREAKSRAGLGLKNVLDTSLGIMHGEAGEFVLEFLQNAEDALMEAGRTGFFRIELDKDRVVITHNGKPIDEGDLEGLCNLASKKKPALGYKGFMGIGWKSVFMVSRRVEVYSNGLGFEFNKEFWSGAQGRELLAKYGLGPENVIWQLTPIPLEAVGSGSGETLFVVHLLSESKYSDVARIVDRMDQSLFLFLEHINKIEIIDNVRGSKRIYEWHKVGEENFEGARVARYLVTLASEGNPTFYKFLVFKKEYEVPEEVRKDDLTESAKRSDVKIREVALAFMLDPKTEDLKPVEGTKFWALYSFLPLTEARTGLRFLIHSDFVVEPSRNNIHPSAKWNAWLMKCVSDLVKISTRYLARNYKFSYLTVFEVGDVDRSSDLYQKLLEPTVFSVIRSELSDPKVFCYLNHEVPLSKAVLASSEVLELIKYGLFSEDELGYIVGEGMHILHPEFKLREADKNKVRTINIEDLFSWSLIEAKMKKNLDEAFKFLGEAYRLFYKKWEHASYYPTQRSKVPIITSSLDIVESGAAYIPKTPSEVEDLKGKYGEVDEYLSRLKFVHGKLVEYLGEDILKWLGVKEISLKELVTKELLPKISVDAEPPKSKEDYMAIVLLAKSVNVVPPKAIWVLTNDGSFAESDKVYYPRKELRNSPNYLEVMKSLGLKVIDIDFYLKYDAKEDGWLSFFSNVAKGVFLVDYNGYMRTYYINPSYEEIISAIKGQLKGSPIDENIKYVRFLKLLYIALRSYVPREYLKRAFGGLKLLTDEDKLVDSDQCFLHDAYGPEEKWVAWRDRGFKIGPFVSLKYMTDDSEVSSWREFFRDVGIMENAKNEIIANFAVWFVEKRLAEMGYTVTPGGTGYDLHVLKEGEEAFVEVKGTRLNEAETINLTEVESQAAHKYGEKYWLIVVEGIPNHPRVWRLRDPVRFVTGISLTSKIIREKGEELSSSK